MIFEKGKKPREIYVNFGGKMHNMHTHRIFPVGAVIGQDDILYNRNRQNTFVAKTELFTLKLERDIFEKMMKEFPEIKTELLEEANIRALYAKSSKEARNAITAKESKLIIRKFNQVSMQQNYDNQQMQKLAATRKRDAIFRRSNEFVFKDKRLRNAQPTSGEGEDGVRRFASKNPKLFKMKQKQERERRKRMGDSFGSEFQGIEEDENLNIKDQSPTLMGKLLVHAKRKMFLTEDSGSEQGRRGGSPRKLIINEEGMKSIIKPDKLTISPERRKTVHMAMH